MLFFVQLPMTENLVKMDDSATHLIFYRFLDLKVFISLPYKIKSVCNSFIILPLNVSDNE